MPTTPWNPEHEALRDSVRRLVDGPLTEAAAQAETGGLPHREAVEQCAALGLLDLDDVLAEVVAAEELGRLRSGGLVAVLLDAMFSTSLGLPALDTCAAGFVEVTVDGARATGEVPFAVGAQLATRLLLPSAGVLVDLDTAKVLPAERSHSLRGAAGGSVVLDGAACEAFAVGDDHLRRAELIQAAAAIGSAWRTWREACDYAQQREAFGRPIAKFQVNRHALADAATRLTAAEALVHDTAWDWAHGRTRDQAPARLYASAVAVEVADRAIQLHGGYGYTTDFDAQRAWRDAHALRIGDDDRRRRIRRATQ